MLVNHFKLSEGSSSRRVAAIRVLTQVPEVKDKIENGELSLSVVASAQRFFNAEAKHEKPLGVEEKKEVLNSLVGKSTREAEKELIQKSSVPLALQVPDQVKPKGAEHVKISFLAPQSLADLLEEARGLLAHRISPDASMAEVVQALAEIGVEKIKKERFGVGAKERKVQIVKPEEIHLSCTESTKKNDIGADVDFPKSAEKRNRYIPMPVRRAVFKRADGKCEYRDPLTQRRCNSSKYLQLHHTTAFAKGGQHSIDGLAAFCATHNKLAAIDDFGAEWMSQFIPIGKNLSHFQ